MKKDRFLNLEFGYAKFRRTQFSHLKKKKKYNNI